MSLFVHFLQPQEDIVITPIHFATEPEGDTNNKVQHNLLVFACHDYPMPKKY